MTTTATTARKGVDPGHRPAVRAARKTRVRPPTPLPIPDAELAGYHDALMRLTVALGTDMPVVTVTRADLRLLIAKVHADHVDAKAVQA